LHAVMLPKFSSLHGSIMRRGRKPLYGNGSDSEVPTDDCGHGEEAIVLEKRFKKWGVRC
jgi:hypothetical protein